MELLSEGMAGMVHAKDVDIAARLLDVELPEDPVQALMTWFGMVQRRRSPQDGRARGEPTPDLNAVAVTASGLGGGVHLSALFPAAVPLQHVVLPHPAAGAGKLPVRDLVADPVPRGRGTDAAEEPVVLPYDSDEFPPIPRQDYSNIPRQQVGLHAGGFEFMRLSKDVEGLISNYQRLIDGYLDGRRRR